MREEAAERGGVDRGGPRVLRGSDSPSSAEPLQGLKQWVLIKKEAPGCGNPGKAPNLDWGAVGVCTCVCTQACACTSVQTRACL